MPHCTKDTAKNPLGVCSIYHENEPVITCPVRFRQDWMIADHAADFFFAERTRWTSLTEVRLNDAHGKRVGNIEVVLVAHDDSGKVVTLIAHVPVLGNSWPLCHGCYDTRLDITHPTSPCNSATRARNSSLTGTLRPAA
ncbi:MAG: NotI family restriction endonuclease [Chloroflexus sp.]|uniref:NotI family restriction endonuclease n=1 Tax=Chloroflexus sp. TaxID=1904827 RepID=UPI00404AB94C